MESHLQSSSDNRLVRVFEGSAISPYAYWFACPPGALERRGVKLFHDWLIDQFGEPGIVALLAVVVLLLVLHHFWGRLSLRRLARHFHLHHHSLHAPATVEAV